MNICVFCSASDRIDPDYYSMSEELGRLLASEGHTIVFGGHDAGLMHSVSKAAHEAGGKVVGVVPKKIEEMGHVTPFLDELIPTTDLSDRKELMAERSDAFIILPGGVGTLDELFCIMAQASLQYHSKPIVLYSMKGFWQKLADMLDDLEQRGLMRLSWRHYVTVAVTANEVIRALSPQ